MVVLRQVNKTFHLGHGKNKLHLGHGMNKLHQGHGKNKLDLDGV
jgi:hypothetical protein